MFISIDHEKCWNDQGVFLEDIADLDFSVGYFSLFDIPNDGRKFSYLKYLGDINYLESRICFIFCSLKNLCLDTDLSDRNTMFYISEYYLAVKKYYPQYKRKVIERIFGLLNVLEREFKNNDRLIKLKSKITKAIQQCDGKFSHNVGYSIFTEGIDEMKKYLSRAEVAQSWMRWNAKRQEFFDNVIAFEKK